MPCSIYSCVMTLFEAYLTLNISLLEKLTDMSTYSYMDKDIFLMSDVRVISQSDLIFFHMSYDTK